MKHGTVFCRSAHIAHSIIVEIYSYYTELNQNGLELNNNTIVFLELIYCRISHIWWSFK